MKALVLAGGSGTRLRPITHTRAKQLVPVANKPVLFYGLEAIRDAGITEVGVVVGDTAPEIEEAVGDGSDFRLQVTYLRQQAPLGLAHAVMIAQDFLGEDPFAMYLGDNFIVGGISDLVHSFDPAQAAAGIMLTPVDDPRQFGVAELDPQGRVMGLEEKPEHPRSDLALVGVYLFTAMIHEAIAEIKPSWRGELEITDALQGLIDNDHPVSSTKVDGYWKDTGDTASMLEVNRLILDRVEGLVDGDVDEESELVGRVRLAEGVRIRRSRIVGPVDIAPGTLITDSYVGPSTSIAANCLIDDSEIEQSIVLENATIQGIRRIEASLIGHHARVTPAIRRPEAHRLVLGDHSEAQLWR